MSQDHNDIYTIVERLAILEGRITPTGVKKGLNPQQKSVPQLPALFKPKHISVLGSKTDPKHPMAGYAVGADESVDTDEDPAQDRTTIMSETDMAEDVLAKVQKSFKDFIKQAAEEIEDADIKEKKRDERELQKKEKRDRDLIAKEGELDAALSGTLPAEQPAGEPGVSLNEAPVKTITNECGDWEMHGNERDGFEVRRAGRSLPTRFSSLEEAELALEMFAHRRRKADESQDYMEER